MTHPLLYTYRRCPYAMRARMALLLAGVAFDAHEVVLRDKPPAMLALSPKGTVPVLLLPQGRVIEQSLEIMQWAFEGRDHEGVWARAQTPGNLAFIACNDGPFKQHLDHYKYPQRFPGLERAAEREGALACLIAPLQERLADDAFLGGEQPCAADLALFPFVRQFRGVDEGWFDAQPFDAVKAWLRVWMEGSQFAACMTRLQPGVLHRF